MTARLLGALFALFMSCTALAGPPPGTPTGMLDFARSLDASGDTYRAATEYLRVLHHFGEDADTRRQALSGLASAYAKAGRWQDSAETLAKLYMEQPDARTRHLLGDALYRAGRTGEAANLLLVEGVDDAGKKLGTLAWLKTTPQSEPPATADTRLVADYRSLPRKEPAIAGTLSALLPGSGHLYVDRPRDAAMAFALNALFLWGTWEAASRKEWGLVGLLGAAEVFWYSGTIVGAVNGAHKWNRREEERFFENAMLEARPRWTIAPVPSGGVVALSWRW